MLDVASTGEYYSIYTINRPFFITDCMTQVELDEAFVPAAQLEEPLEAHNVEALRMWLDTTYKKLFNPTSNDWQCLPILFPLLYLVNMLLPNSTIVRRIFFVFFRI